MEKNGVSLLWIWTDCCDIRLWKNTALCPEIYGSEDMLAPILDVSFLGPEDKKVDIGTITLDLLILDVTDGTWSSGLNLHSLRTKLREQAPAMDKKLSLECFPAI